MSYLRTPIDGYLPKRILRSLSLLCICAVTAFSSAFVNAQTLTVQPAVSISDVNNSLPVAVTVGGPNIATGTVTLIGGGYNSGAQTLDNVAEYLFTIPANSLSVGTDKLTVNYSGDTNYTPLSTSVTVKVATSVPLRVSVIGPVATQVAAGAGHTCVLTAASITQPETIQCWGSNSHGQLGNGTTIDTTFPVQVNAGSYATTDTNHVGVVALAVGDKHTCALRPSTTTYGVEPICWGANASGQLGNGSTADSSTPALTILTSGFMYKQIVALAAGSAHTCALLDDGTAQCWGDNAHGQLGDGSMANSTTPVAVKGLSGAVAIAAGGNHTCALLSDGSVECWGEDGNGQLGNGSTKDSSTPLAVGGLGGSATEIALGGTHTCALLTGGTVTCWGGNAHGQLGNGSITDSSTPVAVSGLVGATTLAAGGLHTCAVVAAGGGTVACWGGNADGQLGDNTITDRTVPVHTGSLTNVTSLTLGGAHTCAQNAVGVLACWGDNVTGQLGNGTMQAGGVLSPLPVNGMGGRAATVSTGSTYACSVTAGGTANLGSGGTLTTNGAPFCWGQNGGQLGNGSTSNSSTPVEVSGLGNTVQAIFTGTQATCAVLTDGSVDCWGGDRNTVQSLTPVKIAGFSGTVTQISITPYFICALISNGTVQCWGNNTYGELGDGTNNNSATPVTVVGVTGATAISGRQFHTCALLSGGTVACWGDGNSAPASAGISGATAISAGKDFNCVLLADKTVDCWGLNAYGQLGNGTTSFNPTGVGPVVGLSGVTLLSAGAEHACALLSDTTVRCWGYNNEGELGNGTKTNSSTPVAVNGLTGATTISAGDGTTLVLVSDGTLQGWGDNDSQQLGDSTGMSSTNLQLNQYVFPVPAFEGQTIDFNPPPFAAVGTRTDLAPLTTGTGDLSATFDTWTIDDCEIDYNGSSTALTVLNSKQPLLCGVRAAQSGGYNLHGGSLAPAASQQRSVGVGASFLAPHAALSPASLTFGSINVGVISPAQVLILSNSGSATLNISGISLTGANASQFNQTSTCGSTLAAGASCTISVTFAPTTPAGAVATVTVADDAAGSPQTAALSGTGAAPAAPAAALTPASIDFGSYTIGSSGAAQTFTLSNAGTAALPITSITISGSGAASFKIASNACGASLAAGASCNIGVTFKPSAAGVFSATLSVSDSVGTQTASMTGTGVAPTPAFTITPTSLDFGNVNVGATKSLAVTLKNVASTYALALSISSSDPTISAASFASSCGAIATPVGGTCTGVISFSPSAVKSYGATITFGVIEAGCGPCTISYPNQTITVIGTGIVPPPAFTVTPSPANFGNVGVGESKTIGIILTNVTTNPVSLSTIAFSDPAFGDLGALPLTCGTTISPGGSCAIPTFFAPTALKSYSGTITLKGIFAKCVCVDVYPDQTITVTGTGIVPPPAFTVTPSPANFGNVGVGESKTIGIILTNVTTNPVSLSTIAFSDPAFGDLGALPLTCGTTISPGGSCAIPTFFAPTALKSYSGTITLKGIFAKCVCVDVYPDQTITVTGTGVAPAPALTITPSALNFGNAVVGQPKVLPVTLTNISSTPLTLSGFGSSDPAITYSLLDNISCFTTVPVGGSCVAYFHFTPTAAKSYSATSTVHAVAKCSGCTTVYPDQTVAATGAGVAPAPALTITPSPLAFGNVTAGLTKSINVTLTNISSTSLVVGNFVSSDPAFDTNALNSLCSSAILSGGSCTAAVRFTPTAIKSYSPTITLSNIVAVACGCTTAYPTQTLAMTGTGVAPAPALTITPSALDFGNVTAGLTKSINVTLTNISSTPVLILEIHSPDPAFTTFALEAFCGSAIPVGGSCTAAVRFNPTAIKSYSATITLNNIFAEACGCKLTYPNQSLAVTGTGVAPAPAPPVFSPSGGTFASKQSVTLGDASFGSTIYFTVDGSTPTASSAIYSSPIAVDSTETLRAIAILSGTSSTVSSASYTIIPASCQTIDYSSGFTASGLSLNGGATINGTALELTDGGLSEARSAFFSTTLPTTSFTTDFTFQITDPLADGMTFTIQSNNATVVGQAGGGLGYAGIPNSVAIKVDLHNNAGEGTDSTGTYIDGAYPSIPAINLAPAGIDLHSGHIFAAHVVYAGGLTKGTIKDTVTGVSASMNLPGDITKVVGNNAWFGFTAGTGGKSATQKILTWSYSGGPGCPIK